MCETGLPVTKTQDALWYISGKARSDKGDTATRAIPVLTMTDEKTQIFRENDPLVKVGHMAEYDAFIAALRRLKDG